MSSWTTTEFRKHLFPLLERVVQGELIEVTYKGVTIRLSAERTTSKLARAKRQDTLLVNPDSIISSDPEFVKEIEGELNRDWSDL